MSGTYKLIDVVGTSADSIEKAIGNAIADAGASVRNLSWFEVREVRGRVGGDAVTEYQVTLRVGFKVET